MIGLSVTRIDPRIPPVVETRAKPALRSRAKVRLPEEAKRVIEELGYEPTRVAKQAILDAIRRARSKKARAWQNEDRVVLDEEVAITIRRDRDDQSR